MRGVIGFSIVSALLLAGAGACLYWYFRQRRLVRLVEATPVSRIGSAERGFAALEGETQPVSEGPIRSPLTDTPCCWYRFRIERRNTSDSGGSWTLINEGTSVWPFLLRDDSGVCAVEPRNAEIFPTDRSVWYGEALDPEDRNPPRHRMTDAAGARVLEPRPPGFVSVKAFGQELTAGQYRYKEERIYPGDKLFVMGLFDIDKGRNPSSTENDMDMEDGAPEDDVDPEADLQDPEEENAVWEDVMKALDYRMNSLYKLTPRGIEDTGSRKLPYVVSSLPPADLVSLQRGYSLGALVMALILFAAAAGVMIVWWKLR